MAENIYDQVDVAQLECHFKWFAELDNDFGGQWRSSLLQKQLHHDLTKNREESEGDILEDHDVVEDPLVETGDENTRHTLIFRLELLSWKCALILRNTFEKNFAEAFRLSNELWEFEEACNRSQPKVHVDTWTYVLLADQLNILKEWRSLADCTMDENQIVEIWKRMESLAGATQSNEANAFIHIMKSNLSRDMQNTQLRVDFAKSAIELNPQFGSWHKRLYCALRCLRRSTGFWNSKPSKLEIDSCVKAYELGLKEHDDFSIGYTIQMAKLYTELMFTCCRGTQEHQEYTELAIKYARDAVQSKPHSKNLKMRLVSLLSEHQIKRPRYRNEGNDDQYVVEAQELVKECEAGPSSSEICHRLGKYYSNPKIVGCDTAKALEWFERSLEAHIGNFPCFADMLKNSIFRRKPTSEILQKIDTLLSSQTKTAFRVQLHFIKGFFLWTDDMEATLHSWLMAIEESADLEINFVGLATRNFCYIKGGNAEAALIMMNNVKFFMSRREHADPVFAKLKDIVNSIIEHFQQGQRVVQVGPYARNYPQRRNYGSNYGVNAKR